MFVKEVIELNSEQFRNCDLGDERMDSLAGGTSPALLRKQPKTGAGAAPVELILSARRGRVAVHGALGLLRQRHRAAVAALAAAAGQ